MQQADSYSRQLRSGFPALCFERPLEAEFRARYATRGVKFLHLSLAVSLVLIGVSCLLDSQLRDTSLAMQSTAVRLLLMAPPVSLALLAVRAGLLIRHLQRILLATAAALSAGSVLLTVLRVAHGVPPTVLDGALLTLFVYLLLGLRFYTAVAFAAPIAATLGVAIVISADVAEGASQIVFLLAVNAVGAIASYRMEHAARTSYLEREMVNLLAGSDTTTGISNRRLFALTASAIRKMQRDTRGPLALGRPSAGGTTRSHAAARPTLRCLVRSARRRAVRRCASRWHGGCGCERGCCLRARAARR